MTPLIALAIGGTVFGVALWAIRSLATPVPPEPDPEDVSAVEADYRCTICGLRLTVTHAQAEDHVPPRHCREPMVEV